MFRRAARKLLMACWLLALCWPVAAQAALECEQLGVVAQTTIKLRDGGISLNAVLAEIERGDLRQQLTAQELNVVRQVVQVSFTSEYSPLEIFEACKAGGLGLPKPKPKP